MPDYELTLTLLTQLSFHVEGRKYYKKQDAKHRQNLSRVNRQIATKFSEELRYSKTSVITFLVFFIPIIKDLRFAETSVTIFQSIRRNIPEDLHLQLLGSKLRRLPGRKYMEKYVKNWYLRISERSCRGSKPSGMWQCVLCESFPTFRRNVFPSSWRKKWFIKDGNL